MKNMKRSLLLAAAAVTCATSLQAQDGGLPPTAIGDLDLTNPPSLPATLPVDLLPPGARALGIGGAFTAVADDSTAALANPAGLTNLTAPEVSVYVRYTDADVQYLDSDAYNSAVNALAGQEIKGYSDSSTDVSFASFVMPLEGVTFSLFYSNQLKFAGVQETPDVYLDDIVRQEEGFPDYAFFDQYTNNNQVSGTVENIGLSAAFRLTDQFSLGLTVRHSTLDLSNSNTWQVDWWNDWEIIAADSFYGDFATFDEIATFLPVINDVYTYNTSINDKQGDMMLDLGLYYKGDKWSFGAVYHAGSKFTFQSVGTITSDFSCNADPAGEGRQEECQFWVDLLENTGQSDTLYPNSTATDDVVVRLPTVISFGTAFRPADTWLLSFDANYVKYGDLNAPSNITLGFNTDINKTALEGGFADPSIPAAPITEEIKDEWTFHLGGEKSFFFDSGVLRNLAVRAGAFTVADHDGIVATDTDDVVWTVGLGTIWGKNEIGAKLFQVDLGASFADDVTNVVLSGIFRF